MMEEKLIEIVKKHPELYDTKHENYAKAKVKTKIWNDIAKELKMRDGEASKNMWLKLRSSFRDARRRYLKQLNMLDPSSAQNNQPTKPWRFHTQMSFLEAFMTSGNLEKNSDDIDNNDDSNQTKYIENGVEEGTEAENVEIIQCKIEEESYGNQSVEYADIEPTPSFQEEYPIVDTNKKRAIDSPPPSYTQPKKKKKADDIHSLISLSMKMREERAKQRETERRKLLEEKEAAADPLRNFFMSMYLTTKNMPLIQQHNVRIKIFQAVSEAEATILNVSNAQSETGTFYESKSHSSVAEQLEMHHEVYVKEEPYHGVNNT